MEKDSQKFVRYFNRFKDSYSTSTPYTCHLLVGFAPTLLKTFTPGIGRLLHHFVHTFLQLSWFLAFYVYSNGLQCCFDGFAAVEICQLKYKGSSSAENLPYDKNPYKSHCGLNSSWLIFSQLSTFYVRTTAQV